MEKIISPGILFSGLDLSFNLYETSLGSIVISSKFYAEIGVIYVRTQ